MFTDPSLKYEKPLIANSFNLWVDIAAPLDLVFRFLTEEQLLTRWWSSSCTSEPRPGGRLHFVWSGANQMTGDAIFRQFDPPHSLVVEWTHHNGTPITCDGSHPRGILWTPINEYKLTFISEHVTRLHLHDYGVNSSLEYESMRQACQTGWGESVSLLKKAAELSHKQKIAKLRKQQERQEKQLS